MTRDAPPAGALLDNLVLFPRILRAAGIPVALEQSMGFVRALGWIDLADRRQVFHAARSLLVTRAEHLALFTALFQAFWRAPGRPRAGRPRQAPRAPRHDPGSGPRLALAAYMAARARETDPEVDVGDRSETFSPAERLQSKDFASLTEEELASVQRLMREMSWRAARRRTRRRIPSSDGSALDLRGALREASRRGGVLTRLGRLDRKVKSRPLVVLADVSGSMQRYSRLLLQFFYGMVHGLERVECFVFATRLTRLTPQLRIRNVDQAVDQAARQALDWDGGTRIGASLEAFNRRWARRLLRRGAVVLVVSDGCERGDAETLRRQLLWLRRRCHRLIWLHPHVGKEGFEPRVEGLAVALPLVDDFLPVHNLRSLAALAAHLESLPGSRGRPSGAIGGPGVW